jgi:hypothetical protein
LGHGFNVTIKKNAIFGPFWLKVQTLEQYIIKKIASFSENGSSLPKSGY